jgi:hypothetical protein
MLILSRVRFTSLTTGWRLQNIAVVEGVGKAWTRYGLVFLVLIVTLVSVLPTDDSMGLFDTVRLGLKVVVDLAHRLMELLILAIIVPPFLVVELIRPWRRESAIAAVNPRYPDTRACTEEPDAFSMGSHTRLDLLADVLGGGDLSHSQLSRGSSRVGRSVQEIGVCASAL